MVCKYGGGKMNTEKLEKIVESEGYLNVDDLLAESTYNSVVLGVCANPLCDVIIEVEPDQDRGWCPNCQANTIVSCLVLAELL